MLLTSLKQSVKQCMVIDKVKPKATVSDLY